MEYGIVLLKMGLEQYFTNDGAREQPSIVGMTVMARNGWTIHTTAVK